MRSFECPETSRQQADIAWYDSRYTRPNYFGYRRWIERPFMKQVIRLLGLTKGLRVLDVGCGQGLFSHLLSEGGATVVGVDRSHTGIRRARHDYSGAHTWFVVADAFSLPFRQLFECVLTRSLSLYNDADFARNSRVTDSLMTHVAPGGRFVFVYNTQFGGDEPGDWRYHTIQDVRQHFAAHANVQIFFVIKVLVLLLGRLAFTPVCTRICSLLSRRLRLGGDIVCIVSKDER